MTLDPRLLAVLACPEDKGPLYYFGDEDTLYNPRLKRRYQIKDGIPVMLIDEAESVSAAEDERLVAKAKAWEGLVDRIKHPTDELTIHVVGKYVGYEDSYKSLNEALYHGGFKHQLKVNIKWIEAEALEEANGAALLEGEPSGSGNSGAMSYFITSSTICPAAFSKWFIGWKT